MLGNQRSNTKDQQNLQVFFVQTNTKEHVNSGTAPFFDVYYKVVDEDGEHKVKLSTDSVSGYVREFYCYDDTFGKKTNKKFAISLDEDESPYMDKNGNPNPELKVRNTYKVSSVFSMKGQELANKLCRVFQERKTNYMSIRFQQQFDKNPQTGDWNIPKKNKDGNNIYNINIFFKENKDSDKVTMVLPLFAKDADWATHESNDEWLEAWNQSSKDKSSVPMGEFYEKLINEEYRYTAFEMFKERLAEKGMGVEMEILDNGKPKYTFTKEGDNPDATNPEGNDTDDGELPF